MRFGAIGWTLSILFTSAVWSADDQTRTASPERAEEERQRAQPPSVRPNKTAPRATLKPMSAERAKLEQCVRERKAPDCDGDGRSSVALGGDDCDDADPQRAPGRLEVADFEGHDEDCDPTYGEFDGDRDGFTRSSAFNTGPDGKRHGGEDCDDARRQVNPNSPEVCNGIDDNCDGAIDEGVTMALYRDQDGDGFGDERSQFLACPDRMTSGVVANASDCNDRDPGVNPITGNCQ